MMGGVAVRQNDYVFFIGTVENYFRTGTMSYIDGKPFAGRMPGYGAPYFLIRLVASPKTAIVCLILLQILFSAIAVYYLARIAERLFADKKAFYLTFVLAVFSVYTSIFDIFTLAESFAVSSVVFALYNLQQGWDSGQKKYFLYAGFFVAWAIFLRPFLGLLIVFMPAVLFLYLFRSKGLRSAFVVTGIFCLPFVVFESAWIARNYAALGKFVPLETDLNESYGKSTVYRTSAIAVRKLIASWGGETGEFYDGSEAWWFHYAKGKAVTEYQFPARVFRSSFTKDSLIRLKQVFNASGDMTVDEKKRDSLNNEAFAMATRYMEAYRKDNAFRYYFINTFGRMQKLVFSNPTLLFPLPKFSGMSVIQKGIKLFCIALYFLVVAGGIISALIYFFRNGRNAYSYLLFGIPPVLALTIMFNPFSIIENRYFICAYPILMLFFVYGLIVFPVVKLKRTR